MNYCNKCGDIIENGEKYCNKCGNKLVNDSFNSNNKNRKNQYIIGILIGIITIGIIIVIVFFISNKNEYDLSSDYITNNYPNNSDDEGNLPDEKNPPIDNNVSTPTKNNNYKTSIIYDNSYEGISFKTKNDAVKLIQNDSVQQKGNCPTNIIEIENRIINNYQIDAINLCEMDINLAIEVENVIKVLYNEFPTARDYLTNITLVNTSISQNYIAAFMPSFIFATSDSARGFPEINKTQILLNSSYFLNTRKLETSVYEGSISGHFPKNATRYSPVAHEFGHYFSFLAMMTYHGMDSFLIISEEDFYKYYEVLIDFSEGNFSLKMITEAYENYKEKTNKDLTLLEFRQSISSYAVTKDEKGNYIYDETIAEAFHDYYLNGDRAADASKEIVQVLKKYVKKIGE